MTFTTGNYILLIVCIMDVTCLAPLFFKEERSDYSVALTATMNSMFTNTPSCVMLVGSERGINLIIENFRQLNGIYKELSLVIYQDSATNSGNISRGSFSKCLTCVQTNRYIISLKYINDPIFDRFLQSVPTNDHDGLIIVVLERKTPKKDVEELFERFHKSFSNNVLVLEFGTERIVKMEEGLLIYYDVTRSSKLNEIYDFVAAGDYFRKGNVLRVIVKSYIPTAFFSSPNQPKEYNGSLNGVEGVILDKALRATGASPLYLIPTTDMDIGYRDDNGTFTGALADVLSDMGELAGNPRLLTYEWMDQLSFTYPHNRDNYCIIVKKAQQASRYLTLILVFSGNVWLATCLTLVVLTLTKYFTTFLQHNRTGISVLGEALFATFRIFMTGSNYGKTSSAASRTFLCKCLIYNIIIMNTFQGSLYSFLTSPKLLPDIHTLQEVNEKLHTIYTFQPYINMFDSLSDGDIMKDISNRMVPVLQNLHQASNEVADNYGFGFLLSNAVNHMLKYTKMKDGTTKFYEVDECALSPAYIGFPVRRHWPGLPRLNSIIQRLLQGGFLQKWLKDVDYEFLLKGTYGNPKPINEPQKLGLEHFQASFCVLAIGLGISSVAFVLEYKTSENKVKYKS